MSDIALAGVVICRLDGPVPIRIDIDIFDRNHAGIAVQSIKRVGRPSESVSGYGFPSDRVIRDDRGISANRGMLKIQGDRTPFGRSGYALKRQGLRRLYATAHKKGDREQKNGMSHCNKPAAHS